MNVEKRRKTLVTAWDRAWGHGEFGPLRELVAEDFRRIGNDSPKGMSLDELIASIITTRAAFPDLVTVIDQVVIEGDVAAVRWHSVGTHQGALLGVPATHRKVEQYGANFLYFEGDLISHEYVTWDPRELLVALGIISVDQDR